MEVHKARMTDLIFVEDMKNMDMSAVGHPSGGHGQRDIFVITPHAVIVIDISTHVFCLCINALLRLAPLKE